MSREIPYGHEVKVFSRSRGESAVAKAAYRAGARLVDQRTGEVHDFTRKAHVTHTEIITPDCAPDWVFDRERLWNQAEASENRSNSQVAREIRLTLPRELSRDQQIALVREWVKSEYVSRGMVADFAIHAPPASDGGEQPHAHIMLTMRHLDTAGPNGFSKHKEREWNNLFADEGAFKIAQKGQQAGSAFVASTAGLERMRAAWAKVENRHLAAAGIDGRVDHRTLELQRVDALARGDLEAADRLNRPTEPKLRPGEKQRGRTERAAAVEDIRSFKAEVIDLASERQRRRKDHSPQAISRRQDRTRRLAEARSHMPRIDSGNQVVKDRYKLKLLQERYQQEIAPDVARDLAWIRMREAAGEVVVQMRDGSRMRDDGATLRAQGKPDDSAFAVMIAAARSHGWTDIQVSGTKEFQRRSAEALTRAGVRVLNADLQDVVERTKRQMTADAAASDRTMVGTALDHARRRLDDAQRAAQETEWTGPDGRRRPFLMKHPQLAQPVPARITDEEVRTHLQPGWPAAGAQVTELREALADSQATFDRMGTLERLRAGRSVQAEIGALRDQLAEAKTHLAALDRAWMGPLQRNARDLQRQADLARDAAVHIRDVAIENAPARSREVGELQRLSRTLQEMSEAGDLRPTPNGLTDAQRLDWLKQQADEWRSTQATNGPPPATRHSPGMRGP